MSNNNKRVNGGGRGGGRRVRRRRRIIRRRTRFLYRRPSPFIPTIRTWEATSQDESRDEIVEAVWPDDPDAHFWSPLYDPTDLYWDTNPCNRLCQDGSGRRFHVPGLGYHPEFEAVVHGAPPRRTRFEYGPSPRFGPNRDRTSEPIWHSDPDAHFFHPLYDPADPYWDTNPYNRLRPDGSGRRCHIPGWDMSSSEDEEEEDEE